MDSPSDNPQSIRSNMSSPAQDLPPFEDEAEIFGNMDQDLMDEEDGEDLFGENMEKYVEIMGYDQTIIPEKFHNIFGNFYSVWKIQNFCFPALFRIYDQQEIYILGTIELKTIINFIAYYSQKC